MVAATKHLMLEQKRIKAGLTKSGLARKAEMQAGMIGWIESGRFTPYDAQLEKIANALDWQGDPSDLLKEVD